MALFSDEDEGSAVPLPPKTRLHPSEEDLFGQRSNAKHSQARLFTSSDEEDLFTSVVSRPAQPSQSFASVVPRPVQPSQSLFTSSDDEEPFTSVVPRPAQPSQSLFTSSDEEDLFTSVVPRPAQPSQSLLLTSDNQLTSAVVSQRPKEKLFCEESDDDLFGGAPSELSATVKTVSEAVERLELHDPRLYSLSISGGRHTQPELAGLVDCLIAHPNQAGSVLLSRNQLTDETGVKLARYLAASTVVRSLYLSGNRFGDATYLAIAAALRVNCSLRHLHLDENQATSRDAIDSAFVEALRLNRNRQLHSEWFLYDAEEDLFAEDVDYRRLKAHSDDLGHVTLQTLLVHLLSIHEIK